MSPSAWSNDKILAVNTLYRSFVGSRRPLRRTRRTRIISDEVLAQFGSPRRPTSTSIESCENGASSWYELRERDQHPVFVQAPLA
jgi:hypothetical protein